MKRKERIEDLIKTILAYIIFIILCGLGVGILLLVLKLASWLLTWEYIRTGIIIGGCIGIVAMLYLEFGKEE